MLPHSGKSSTNVPASARVMHIPELLEMILEPLDIEELRAMARTARFLHIPAARILWREVGRAKVLHFLALAPTPEDSCVDLFPETWDRFRLYASLVEILQLDFYSLSDEQRTYLRTGLAQVPIPLLPKVRFLSLRTEYEADLDACLCLVSSRLKSVSIYFDPIGEPAAESSASSLSSLLSHICKTCPGLTIFQLDCPEMPQQGITAIENIIRMPELTSFTCDWYLLKPSIFLGLSRSARLSTLVVHCHTYLSYDLDGLLLLNLPPIYDFRVLSSLSLDGALEDICYLLSFFSKAPLVRIFILSRRLSYLDADYLRLCRGVQTFHATLQDINIHWLQEAPNSGLPVAGSSFSPLLQCALLRRVTLTDWDSDPSDLKDSHVSAMAIAWPRLRQLLLQFGAPEHRVRAAGLLWPKSLTAICLDSLGRNCPDLQSVLFSYVDTRDLPAPSPTLMNRSHKMQSLRFYTLRPPDPHKVLSFITALWPGVRVSSESCDTQDGLRWQALVWEE